MIRSFRRLCRGAFERLEASLDGGFGARLNPLHHLGALTIFFFWIVLVSGIWLLIFFRTSVDGAYESVEHLTRRQWYLGGVMRSLHRYASDAAIVTLLLHIAREWVYDRYRGKRWFSWITGVPLLWVIIPLGITGYWLVWDRLAHYVALTSAELLDALPIFTDSMARNFLSDEALSDRFFTLMAFLHLIGLPLFLVITIWLHLFRISRPHINPPRLLMTGTLSVMLVLALVYPAVSQGKANLAEAPQSLALDWYYLPVYPLVQAWSPAAVWLLLVAISLLLMLAPWLPPARKRAVARVDLDNCNGCRRCEDDCPYGAITMQPRSDGKRYEIEAVVDPALCVSCGICAGACPTATPFRKASALSPGIDLPDLSAALLRDRIEAIAETLRGNRVMVFGCADGRPTASLADHETAVIELRCMAQLSPTFIDFILSRDLADGVFLAGCRGGDCQYRMGSEWTRQRVQRERDPQLRRRIDTRWVCLAWDEDSGQPLQLRGALAAFRERLASRGEASTTDAQSGRWPPRWWRRVPMRIAAFALFAAAASVFSAWPDFRLLDPGQAVISLTFSHTGQRVEPCRALSQEELERLPPNMRQPVDCPRRRHPLRVTLRLDGDTLYQATVPPSGLWQDGDSTVYARFPVAGGRYRLFIGMNDSGRKVNGRYAFDYALDTQLELEAGRHAVMTFDNERRAFLWHQGGFNQ